MSAIIRTPAGVQTVPATPTPGMANPMTALGDLIYGGADGAPTRRAIGAEGEVQTVVGGEPAWAPAAAGGPTIDTGTYAARPASPAVGDSYTVTSGVRRGSVYRCDVAGTWDLANIAVPQLGGAVAIFDGETLPAAGVPLRRWQNLASRRRGYDLTTVTTLQPTSAVGATGLMAYDTDAGIGGLRGILPGLAGAAPRSLAILVDPGTTSVDFNLICAGWGIAVNDSIFEILCRAAHSEVWAIHYYGTNGASAVASTEADYVVIVATYDGTTMRLYREGVEIFSGAKVLLDAYDAEFGIATTANSFASQTRLRLPFAAAWDVCLSGAEVTTLTTLLRARYGL